MSPEGVAHVGKELRRVLAAALAFSSCLALQGCVTVSVTDGDKPVAALSGGMKQRAMIAMTLVEMGMDLKGVATELNLESALELLMEDTGTEDELLAEGWKRCFIADEPRLSDAIETYEEMGLEVALLPVDLQDRECSECMKADPSRYRVIFTRERKD